jgi:hypothetical protein
MTEYAILLSPSTNRVYARSSIRLLCSEIRAFNDTVLGGKVHELTETSIGGVPYISIVADEFTETDVAYLANLSSLYALFERRGELLRPIGISPLDKFDSDLLTIQKYSGKTNEHFTKLLLNVAAVYAEQPDRLLNGRLRVLDPMCGRGTTLNQAMMYGLSVSGVDVDGHDIDAYSTFLKTWLKNSRLKHTTETATIRRGRDRIGKQLDISLGVTKELYKAGDTLDISVVNGDTLHVGEFFKPESFDVVLADTPYGVQHESRGRQTSRSPAELLEQAIPAWAPILREGGTIGLSFNTYVVKRPQLAEILAANGLSVVDTGDFTHRVDQAINRDLIIARKESRAGRTPETGADQTS